MQKDSIIYLNERPLIIVPTHQAIPNKYKDAVLYTLPDQHTIESTLQALETGKLPAAIFINPDTDVMLDTVKSYFSILVAAGGLITNQEEEILLMFRRGKWDLPKGKQDEGENLEACALREVEEETGAIGEIVEPVTPIDYWYQMDEEKRHKTVYYYLMRFVGGDITKHDWEMENVEWLPEDKVAERLTYPSDKKVWIEARERIQAIAVKHR